MRLVVRRDRLLRDAAIAVELETGAERPAPDFGCAGLPLRTVDLGAWPPRPGHLDGLGDELGGTPRPLHGKFGEHGAGKLIHCPAGPLAFQRAYGLREHFQAEDTHRVIEQAQLGPGTAWTAAGMCPMVRRRARPPRRVCPRPSAPGRAEEAGGTNP